MKVAIYGRKPKEEQEKQLLVLIEALVRHKIDILIHEQLICEHSDIGMLPRHFSTFSSHDELDNTVDALISLGGDGTMLDSAVLVRNKNIPILGINFGRLGFLAGIHQKDIVQAVNDLANGRFIKEKRTLLHMDSKTPVFNEPFALNEFAIHKTDTSSMINIQAYLNGEFLNNYWADGLIVSTATGSTGYNMSCNGPIVFPDNACFVITPIAPHSFNARSVIIPDNYVVSFEVGGRASEFICTMDARRELVDINTKLAIRKETFEVSLLQQDSFLSTLRKKLMWGNDTRN